MCGGVGQHEAGHEGQVTRGGQRPGQLGVVSGGRAGRGGVQRQGGATGGGGVGVPAVRPARPLLAVHLPLQLDDPRRLQSPPALRQAAHLQQAQHHAARPGVTYCEERGQGLRGQGLTGCKCCVAFVVFGKEMSFNFLCPEEVKWISLVGKVYNIFEVALCQNRRLVAFVYYCDS